MRLQGMWHEFMADAGNAPGKQKGDVVVSLMYPLGGVGEYTVPSGNVSLAAEAGNLIGVQVMLTDGRRLFVPADNLAGIIDAPLRSGKADDAEERPAGGRGRRQPAS